MDAIKKMLKGDRYIWGIYFFLCMLSLIEMYSASSTLTFKIKDYFAPTIRHAMFLAIGTVGVVALHNIHYRYFKAIAAILLPLSIILLIYTMIFAEVVNGAQRWISIFGIPLQPSELAKLGVIIAIAFVLSKKQEDKGASKDTFGIIVGLTVVYCGLIFPENFSTAILLGGVSFFMMIVGRVQIKKLVMLVVVCVGALVLLFGVAKVMPDEVKTKVSALQRLDTWTARLDRFVGGSEVPDYFQKTVDDNYQEHHAKMALANGGLIGKFPGNSRERDFLPQAYSDFIFAIIIEELGLWFGILVLILYICLLVRAGMIARRCKRTFPAFLMMGTALMVVLQALTNMSVATGLIPVTGQPLPLVSRGGTSTLITCVYFGIMLSISQFALTEEELAEENEGVKRKRKATVAKEETTEISSNTKVENDNKIENESNPLTPVM